EDSVYHEYTLGLRLELPVFVVKRRINSFQLPEDFTLGFLAGADLGRAFRSFDRGRVFDEGRLSVAFGFQRQATMVLGNGVVDWWWDRSHRIRRLADFSLRAYHNSLSFLTLAGRVWYVSDWRAAGIDELVLGGLTGLRGYDRAVRTGDRRLVMNFEGRFFSNVEILSIGLGGAVFADVGRTWKSGEPLSFRDFSASVGIGLRVSLEKIVRSELIRIDLSHGQDDRWQLSFGTGQYF
ncbi:MAG: hypothetical protein D6800_05930, partial [Candidatus Zixiibacteriota bacterium]